MPIPVAEAFKRFRRTLNLSQRDVAKRLNITQPAYAVYESQGVSPTGNTLVKMATEFNISVDYLLGLIDEPRPLQRDTPRLASPPRAGPTPDRRFDELNSRLDKIQLALEKYGIDIDD